jgi:hypothetical protein
MANKHKGEVAFEVKGVTYTLHYSTNASCELEDLLNRGSVDIALEMQSWSPPLGPDKKPLPETAEAALRRVRKIKLSLMRAVFWAGLRDFHPELTVKDVGNLMSEMGGAAPVMEKVNEAMAASIPDEEEKPADGRPPKPLRQK